MAYSTVATMMASKSLLDRCAAAAATETANTGGDARLASVWSQQRAWDLASTPGWAGKWESADANGITDPGANEGVITDGDILSRVQPLLADFPMSDLVT